ncbi:ADP-ribosylglycohydrolase family protein [Undibacterium sp. TJN19]|uniref:ADP-ribosylglycohydrolase family protein n=1 Tax=Undibacterium sp. TJN19 TaxID=3413055 RepID=UPI003BF2A06D
MTKDAIRKKTVRDICISTSDAIAGCLVGGAVGDAIGLPFEGLSPRRIEGLARFPLKHQFFFGRGMISDDTDHSIFVTHALLRSDGDLVKFRKKLSWSLRLWLLCLPAGTGWATLRSIIRLWLGLRNSGVYSAGNGPCMRSAMIGAILADDALARRQHVEVSTLLTHTDPKALAGAMAIAEVSARLVSKQWQKKPPLTELIALLTAVSADAEWQGAVLAIQEACVSAQPVQLAKARFGNKNGISGYTLHTVPFALVVWYRHFSNYRATIEEIVKAGGDVDSIAAISGALAGATTGCAGVPEEWQAGIADWPHSRKYMQALAQKTSHHESKVSLRFSVWLFPRNIVFTIIVLLHGFRRLLPPY